MTLLTEEERDRIVNKIIDSVMASVEKKLFATEIEQDKQRIAELYLKERGLVKGKHFLKATIDDTDHVVVWLNRPVTHIKFDCVVAGESVKITDDMIKDGEDIVRNMNIN